MSGMRRSGGFTLVELTVLVVILVALAAVVVPIMGGAARDQQVGDVLRLVESLRAAAHRFVMDTGRCPVEDTSSSAKDDHQLAFDTGLAGWKGPYLDHALMPGDGPLGGDIEVIGSLDKALGGGFDLTGAGLLTATGAGCFVRFEHFPAEVAFLVDDAVDRGMEGDWHVTGRVRYVAASQKLDVFLFDLDGR